MRRIDGCINCLEEREIAAHGLCFKCYRAAERAQDKNTVIDRHTGAIQKDRLRLFRAYSEVIVGLGKLRVNKRDLKTVIRVLRPYFAPIGEMLRDSGTKPGRVNGEQKLPFTPFTQRTPRVSASSKGRTEIARTGLPRAPKPGDSFSTQIESGEQQ